MSMIIGSVAYWKALGADWSLAATELAPFRRPETMWEVALLVVGEGADFAYNWTPGSLLGSCSMAQYLQIPAYDPFLQMTRWSGQSTERRFSGLTVDGSLTPIGGVTVYLFHTINNTLIAQTVSDAGGYYEFLTHAIFDECFLMAQLPGTPNLAGVTANNVVAS